MGRFKAESEEIIMRQKTVIWLAVPAAVAALILLVYGMAPSLSPGTTGKGEGPASGPQSSMTGSGMQTATSEGTGIVIRLGDPIWITATIANDSKKPMTIIRPDCFNTVFVLKAKHHEETVYPSCRLKTPYDIPEDLVTLEPRDPETPSGAQGGKFQVTCNLAEHPIPIIPPEKLAPGTVYRVEATYRNDIQDPDLTKEGCKASDGKCYPLWTGTLQANPSITEIKVESSPLVIPVPVRAKFLPDKWDMHWTADRSPRVTVEVTGIDFKGVDPGTVRLNGTVPIIPDGDQKVQAEPGRLSFKFDGWQALQSLGTPVPGVFYATVQGQLSNTYFTATQKVTIENPAQAQ
jgi:hypothetical protein